MYKKSSRFRVQGGKGGNPRLSLLIQSSRRVRHNWNWRGFGDSYGKESARNAVDLGFNPWAGKIPWRREWLPTLVFLPGEFHGQRSLRGLQSMGSQRARHSQATNTLAASHMFWCVLSLLLGFVNIV